MSVLIRGMDEIPEDGAVLIVKHDDNGRTYIKYADMMGYSMELVELPEKHGDLIDKDVLLDDLLIHADSYFADFARLWTNKQPAVIKAEGAEK